VRTGTHGTKTLVMSDVDAIKSQIPLIKSASPNVDGNFQVVYGNQNWYTGYRGVSPEYFEIKRWGIDEGAAFTQEDVDRGADVCAIGRTVRQQLFGAEDPIGKVIRVKDTPCRVVAVLHPKGLSASGQDQDDTILIPYTSAMERLVSQTTVNTLTISATDSQNVESVQSEVTTLLEQRHRIVPPQQDDFQVRNLQDIAAAASSTGAVMEFLLAGVAAVSLIVGGIGIMNIMLVSVTERTREIGLRMAVGARGALILRQFLTEAIVLASAGGVIGVILGITGTELVALLAKWPMVIPPAWIASSLLFSAMVGVFFGYYPARKASQLHPIEALRFE
jgi:putative ABC transport system permease protein